MFYFLAKGPKDPYVGSTNITHSAHNHLLSAPQIYGTATCLTYNVCPIGKTYFLSRVLAYAVWAFS